MNRGARVCDTQHYRQARYLNIKPSVYLQKPSWTAEGSEAPRRFRPHWTIERPVWRTPSQTLNLLACQRNYRL